MLIKININYNIAIICWEKKIGYNKIIDILIIEGESYKENYFYIIY